MKTGKATHASLWTADPHLANQQATFVKTKAHRTMEQASLAGDLDAWIGNDMADSAAKRKAHELLPRSALHARAAQIKALKYLAVVAVHFQEADHANIKQEEAAMQQQRDLHNEVNRVARRAACIKVSKTHTCVRVLGRVLPKCTQCHIWVNNPKGHCQPLGEAAQRAIAKQGEGHHLLCAKVFPGQHHNFVFCAICAQYTHSGFNGLSRPCPHLCKSKTRANRIARGLHPTDSACLTHVRQTCIACSASGTAFAEHTCTSSYSHRLVAFRGVGNPNPLPAPPAGLASREIMREEGQGADWWSELDDLLAHEEDFLPEAAPVQEACT
jgi:hypothetical protein